MNDFDPDAYLKESDTTVFDPNAYLTTFDPDAYLATVTEPAAEPNAVPQLPVVNRMPLPSPYNVQTVGPGVGSVIAQTPMGQNVGRIMAPYSTAGSKLLGQYAANPITRLAPDLLAAAYGVPPPFATGKLIEGTQGAYNVARKLPPSPTPKTVNPIMNTEFGQEIARRAAAAEAENLANRSMIQKIAMSKVMQTTAKVAAPVLNTAARIAGPAGLAYNVYEAGEMARDTQLGQRLAQGQGQRAEQALRQGLGMTYQGPRLSTVEAQNVLQSGSPRDIEFFGGRDALTEMIRRQAAQQVMGPVAPGNM